MCTLATQHKSRRRLSRPQGRITATKWIEDTRTVELTERNAGAFLAKLDDELSACAVVSGCGRVMVCAAEDTDRIDFAAQERHPVNPATPAAR